MDLVPLSLTDILAIKYLRRKILTLVKAEVNDKLACACKYLKGYAWEYSSDALPFDHPESPFFTIIQSWEDGR
jgi:hypothetical protein